MCVAGYLAPEMWRGEAHTEKVNVWALTVISADLIIHHRFIYKQ